jgi:glycosyltransferase involved in cell wall biosynthesis
MEAVQNSQTRVQIVIPVLNEEKSLRSSVTRLATFLSEPLYSNYSFRITITDNGSTDSTKDIARQLSSEIPELVSVLCLPERGRGRALKTAWMSNSADIHCYMDVDLSTDLSSLPAILDPVASANHSLFHISSVL